MTHAITPAPPPSAAELDAERARLMAELAISFNGRHYQSGRHRYRLLTDAVSYAQRARARASGSDAQAQPAVPAPTHAERQQMISHGITFQDGFYRLGDYRYDRLADALDYAGLGASA